MDEAVENAGKALRLWAEDEPELPKAEHARQPAQAPGRA